MPNHYQMFSAGLVVRELFWDFKNPLILGATKYNRPFVLCVNDSETFPWQNKFVKMDLENIARVYCSYR